MKPETRSNNRLDILLDSAAELFSTRGYQATTMRDIAKACGMLPGSIYYHYANKEALLVAVYDEGVKRLTDRVTEAQNATDDPWTRLEKTLATHIEMIIEPTAYASVIIRILPGTVPSAEQDLIDLRNRYETVLRDLVEALPLPVDVDRRLLRLFLIGAVNHVPLWHKPGGSTPADIARELVRFARCPALIQSKGSE
ncbi:TetR/AcrR family transcriptional regulator [Mameliella sediminis]|uniref:TetR/AcrR family transcriptional regulator n=1 Tax=Mameliella sediminis TaxID=2836866 RepID=UPI001C460944|nr:TetR/AcrR family transcriptional regulator [Mameliella sediminis]MBY6146884.1 TetR/AcrR family transcriptional regulator [Mameliella alba]MBV7397248.1 TetR/AcrR family transcriptional regulator [Mameliella sediminis]MBY6163857.1 TetR/AcrR family transcriptional regulator [Mameliella alba]MBY6172268.1 TetR/AcrR family transcriptional regulator [Mameliella alba]MBY6177344.1 TetR/AcrR family transcriptional regulator [Mameliella alba]